MADLPKLHPGHIHMGTDVAGNVVRIWATTDPTAGT
jgi:hypothetical protein